MSSKLDILRSYRFSNPPTLSNIRDAWQALGGITIKKSTRIYNEGMIYRIEAGDAGYPNSALISCLVYCDKEYIGNLNWNNATLIDSDYGEISFGNNIVSSHFYVVLTKKELSGLKDVPVNPNFIPFKELYEKNDSITISDEDYETIMSCMGVPFIREEELEFTREEICKLALRPALEIMFKWCPHTRPEIVNVTTNVQNVDMPSDAYGVVGLSLQQAGSANSNVTNPLIWSTQISPYLEIGQGMNDVSVFGSPLRSANRSNTLLLNNAAMQGLVNYRRRVHYEGPYEGSKITRDDEGNITNIEPYRYITIYSNIEGEFNVWWGIKSNSFGDVEFAQRDNAIKLCQAKVKQLFGNLRRQSKSDIPGQVDYNYLIEEGVREEQEVVEVLKKLTKASGVLRGSL